ncbi:Uncharacterised protein [Leclercia adecarboxylata]|uniref:Uncharacterized protein n=1 Tax=Leclercia adecarboxylata TaxID=83655 RepID=A0A4U9HY55_9ENTR|nr:Uncharacterised protein [Leclercia adecarboxylata]
MGFALPNGATVFVGSKLATPVAVTGVSNAAGAVFTVANGHGLAVGRCGAGYQWLGTD